MTVEYEVRTEQRFSGGIGSSTTAIKIIGVYDPQAHTRESYADYEYADLVTDIGATEAAALAAQAGWSV